MTSAPTFAQESLSAEQVRTLGAARARAKKVLGAARFAAFSGWCQVIFGGVTLIGGMTGDWLALALGIALCASGYFELRGGRLLKGFDPHGARVLAVNQAAAGGAVLLYALWMLYSSIHPAAPTMSTGDAQTDQMIQSLTSSLTMAVYGGLAACSLVVPALTAWYYLSRAKLARELVGSTPEWALEALRIAA